VKNLSEIVRKLRIRIGLLLLKKQTAVSDELVWFLKDFKEFRLPTSSPIYSQNRFYGNINEYKIALAELQCITFPETSHTDPLNGDLVIHLGYMSKEKFQDLIAFAEKNLTTELTNSGSIGAFIKGR
jgi:hypothetical protein